MERFKLKVNGDDVKSHTDGFVGVLFKPLFGTEPCRRDRETLALEDFEEVVSNFDKYTF